ncbi:alpha/beta hydrolase [Aspergillus undulatus]|uniref:alpha/beta hydrolase n=1 Tax=Aspergillus undulatus TaxID=1810928 RepID=UPI003CCDB1A9
MPLSPEIQSFILQFGNNWNTTINAACENFFEAQHSSLPEVPIPTINVEKGIKYGEDERHRLDIYWPDGIAGEGAPLLPVVTFFHGGAFVAGDTDITPHMHANIAHYLAANGMVGVLGTYRLLPEARFPDGAEDISAALDWIHTHVKKYGGDKDKTFAIGHSAGGSHLAMAMFLNQVRQLPKGVLLWSAAMWYDLTQERRRANMEMYYGTKDWKDIQARSALGLFQGGNSTVVDDVDMFVVVAERDFEECLRGNLEFLKAFVSKRERLPRFEVLMRHNHISPVLAIGLPGDGVGPRVVQWVRES